MRLIASLCFSFVISFFGGYNMIEGGATCEYRCGHAARRGTISSRQSTRKKSRLGVARTLLANVESEKLGAPNVTHVIRTSDGNMWTASHAAKSAMHPPDE